MIIKNKGVLALGAALTLISSVVNAAQIEVRITNNAPNGGTYLTPTWVGFHNGSFDTFNVGSATSSSLESLVEDGNTAPLSTSFQGSGVDGVLGAGPIAPNQTVSNQFTVSDDGSQNYFSYASMLLPSSDFFIGNSNPFAFNISALLDGSISSLSFDVGTVYDAGTEINDFATSAGNPLFGIAPGQTGPNQGADENGVITAVNGLAFASFLNVAGIDTGRFNFDNFGSIATIEIVNVSAVPVPAALFMFAPALLGFLGLRRKAANQLI
ncbi:MAG: spondin domain-containing protein [Methylophaga sp.]|nr:spondin domain-containing protein [Methylophaga sp.]